jgi:hypothetical protein
VRAQDADYGEVAQPGFLGRLFGRRPKIVRDANLAAAAAGDETFGRWRRMRRQRCPPGISITPSSSGR